MRPRRRRRSDRHACALGKKRVPKADEQKLAPLLTSVQRAEMSPTLAVPYFSYALSTCLHSTFKPPRATFRRIQMVSPSTTIIFCEEPDTDSTYGETNGEYISEDASHIYAPSTARHSGGLNFVMGDGHAQWIKLEDYCRDCPSDPGNWSDSGAGVTADWYVTRVYHWWFALGINNTGI